MPFLVAEISYAKKSTTVCHDNSALCKDPWSVHSVPCIKHTGEMLSTNVWAFSEYADWDSDGKQAKLTVAALEASRDPKDKELLDLFNKGTVQIKIKVQFHGSSRVYDLSLNLKP